MGKSKDNYCVRCYDCDRIYYPLEKSSAIEIATQHCEKTEHMDVHAMPFQDILPLIGTFTKGET